MTIMGTLVGITTLNLRELYDPSQSAAAELAGFLKKSKARALASTRAYTISPSSSTEVTTTYGKSCNDPDQIEDSRLTFSLPKGSELEDTSWSICYGVRGLANGSADIKVKNGDTEKTVQVAMGGAVRIL